MRDTEGPPSAGPRRIYGMERTLRIGLYRPRIAQRRKMVQGGYPGRQAGYRSGVREARKLEAAR